VDVVSPYLVEWSQPRTRLQRASVAAAAFLRALQRAGTASAAGGISTSGPRHTTVGTSGP